jgi:uncharacterized OB-fold protein
MYGVEKKLEEEFSKMKAKAEFTCFICLKCGRIYYAPPLSGKCYDCKGDIGFFSGWNKRR